MCTFLFADNCSISIFLRLFGAGNLQQEDWGRVLLRTLDSVTMHSVDEIVLVVAIEKLHNGVQKIKDYRHTFTLSS